jgi:aryl-phospho-beta-D-glucosidase BglC (GH1 family)
MRALVRAYHESWIKEDDFVKLAAVGVNCVRLPIYFGDLMRHDGTFYTDYEGTFGYIDWCVETARKHGIYTLLDLHGAPGSQNGADHSGRTDGAQLYDSPTYRQQCVNVWKAMATHYRGNSAVCGYDLLNEPSKTFPSQMGPEVESIYTILYDSIRAIDPDHIIVMEAIWSWNLLSNPTTKNWTNVVYETHHYAWNADRATMIASMNNQISDITNNLWKQYKIPHLFGEFGVFGGAWNEVLSALVNGGMNWTTWSYKQTANNGWPLYYSNGKGQRVNVGTDSYEQILQKWSNWDTQNYFTANQAAVDAFTLATKLRGEPKRPNTSTTPVAPTITGQPQNTTVAENGSATLSVTASGSPLNYQWKRNGVTISGARGATLTLKGISLSDNGANFSVTVLNDLDTVVSQNAKLTVTPFAGPFVRKTLKAITLDGVADAAWDSAQTVAVGQAIIGAAPSATDFSGKFRTLWDDNSLYFLINVDDDVQSTTGSQGWDQDGVELFVDLDNSKGSTYDSNDFQFRFALNATTVWEQKSRITGVQCTRKSASGAYCMEVAIPWSTLGGAAPFEKLIGVEVELNDNDGASRENKLAWSATQDNAYSDPSVFGQMKLVSEKGPSAIQPLSSRRISTGVYGLQLSGQHLMITMPSAQQYLLALSTVTGRVVAQSRGCGPSASIPTDRLANGMYVVSVKSTRGQFSRQILIRQ